VAKTVFLNGTFEIKNASAVIEAKKVTKVEQSFDEATQHFPQKVAGNTVDHPIGMGGVAQAKKVFLRVDQEVTLKLSEITDSGFLFGPGDMWVCSSTGITGVWVTTGPNETEVEAIVVGS
jgi:hypothetical protein